MSAAHTPVESPARRIHVLHVVSGDLFSRFGRMYRELGLALTDLGAQITFLTDSDRAREMLDIAPLEARSAPGLSGWRSWGLRNALAREFGACAAVHLWGADAMTLARPWAHHQKIPLLLHATSDRDADLFMRRGLRARERVAAMCAAHLTRFHERWPTLGESGAIHDFPPALLPPADVEDITPRGRTLGLVWCGRIEPGCGLDTLVRALALLDERHVDAQLIAIGLGKALEYWTLARKLGVHHRLSLVGDACMWDATLAGADILILPRNEAEFSLAGMLAMALGKIVIAAGDTFPDWYVDGESTCQVACDPAAIADAVRRVADADPNILALGRSAAQHVRKTYSVPRLAESLMETYAAMSGRGEAATA